MGPKVIHRVKIMALVSLSNLFATARAHLLSSKDLRTAAIERSIKFLRSKKSADLRMTAAGLLLNYSMFWPLEDEDDMIMIECAIFDNLSALTVFEPSSASTELGMYRCKPCFLALSSLSCVLIFASCCCSRSHAFCVGLFDQRQLCLR